MAESNAMVQQQQGGIMTPAAVQQVQQQVNLIQHLMKDVMKDGEHFGAIPGCGDKPALKKPGAEKIMFVFNFVNEEEVQKADMGNYHREYDVKTILYTRDGVKLGVGVGSCSTMEGKYRFRTGAVEFTGQPVPRDYWNVRGSDPVKAQEMLGGKGFVTKKNDDGQWEIAMQGAKVEHDNPPDYYNTVLKMAKKRSLVDAVLTVTAASDIFTQDIDDNPDLYGNGNRNVDADPAGDAGGAKKQKGKQTTPENVKQQKKPASTEPMMIPDQERLIRALLKDAHLKKEEIARVNADLEHGFTQKVADECIGWMIGNIQNRRPDANDMLREEIGRLSKDEAFTEQEREAIVFELTLPLSVKRANAWIAKLNEKIAERAFTSGGDDDGQGVPAESVFEDYDESLLPEAMR